MIEGADGARASVRFGPFEVDFKAAELRKQGVRVKLQDQPFQVLRALLEHPGEIVTREELRNRIWPADTFVDFDQGLNNAVKRLREALNDSAENPHVIATIPRRGYRFIAKLGRPTPLSQIESLVVLPLENLSHDPEQEYFTDGMTEAIIGELARVGGFRVVSRITAMHYKGVHRPLPEIARELKVDAVIEGTVVRSDSRVRISVQLIDARTDTHLWAQSYDRELGEILGLYSELALSVASQVCLRAGGSERIAFEELSSPKRAERVTAINPEAYEAYLKGRYHWNKRTPVGVKKGAEYFQKAIEKDPRYSAAYAGLADSAGLAGFWGFVHPEEGCQRAKIAANRSLEIEETAEAHSSLGWAITHYDFDWLAAERQFQRGMALNPHYATSHQWYGHCLAYTGRSEESIAETTKALELDPLSLIIHASCAGAYWFARRPDCAIEVCYKGLELDPGFAPLHWLLAHVFHAKGMFDEAVTERQKSLALSPGAPVFLGELGATYAAAGERAKALEILEQLREISEQRYVMKYWIALIYAGLKEDNDAFHWLERAYQERSAQLAFLYVDPRLEHLHSDQRFRNLVRRMNFPGH